VGHAKAAREGGRQAAFLAAAPLRRPPRRFSAAAILNSDSLVVAVCSLDSINKCRTT